MLNIFWISLLVTYYYTEEPVLILVLLNPDIPCLCKQCRSRSVGFWPASALFVVKNLNLYEQLGLSNLIGEIRSGHGILIYSAWQGLRPLLEHYHLLNGMDTLSGVATLLKKFCLPSKKECTLKGKNLLPKFFPIRVDSFSEVTT